MKQKHEATKRKPKHPKPKTEELWPKYISPKDKLNKKQDGGQGKNPRSKQPFTWWYCPK